MHPKPVIDQRAAEQMNLNVLRRIDPQIEELLATAGHVALYDFDIPTKRWSRKDVEGSLFLVKRRLQPRFQFIILNKKSAVATDNFVEDVHGGFQCEVQKPYVLYRNRANEVVGIWFYDDADCDRISALLQRIASTFAAPAEAGAGASTLLTPAADDSAVHSGSDADMGRVHGDNGFWDRQVEVPDEVQAPDSQPVANGQPALQAPEQPMQLLTPQLLQQEAASAVPPAVQARPAPAADVPAPAAGSELLQSLLRGSTAAAPPTAPPAPHSVDITEAADRALRSKVASLLSALAGNDAFCGILAAELKRAGLV
ncbi:mRNA-decapping enzyme isoform B [Micractinium conductrix]|uniref:mRNA-decapping enzyme isoform B n=1 Tax=Micractinium conductrix TaxID=554055 RepID=A0A2P6VK42_9CHLO|nr:mRNA-decapping enzyme isoform B [Micractinium conductrix]|eukprot:PSC74420.1 mRNA-decapping enzyme isoform B [Micractinium conductrix]